MSALARTRSDDGRAHDSSPRWRGGGMLPRACCECGVLCCEGARSARGGGCWSVLICGRRSVPGRGRCGLLSSSSICIACSSFKEVCSSPGTPIDTPPLYTTSKMRECCHYHSTPAKPLTPRKLRGDVSWGSSEEVVPSSLCKSNAIPSSSSILVKYS